MSEAFGRQRRLTQKAQFRLVHAQGRRYDTPWFACHILDTGQRDQATRLGITASRKTGRAHDRNRYKRWAREVFRRHELRGGADIVVRFRPAMGTASFEQFRDALVRVFERARLL